jgi:hypothetical protein
MPGVPRRSSPWWRWKSADAVLRAGNTGLPYEQRFGATVVHAERPIDARRRASSAQPGRLAAGRDFRAAWQEPAQSSWPDDLRHPESRGTRLHVRGLDAIDGPPVLDIRPAMREFQPRGDSRQPDWSIESMAEYWAKR